MLIQEKDKSINLNVIAYEFPDEEPSPKDDFNFDANWLRVELVYCDENTKNIYTDSCLLTTELSVLVKAFQRIIDGRENNYISDFLEPYLSVCVAKVDEFIIFVLSFVYDTLDDKWAKIGVSAKWTQAEAEEKLKELIEIQRKFPKR